jgi:hypothetical protein
LRLFHQGQFEGRRKHISPHLDRGPNEPVDSAIARFYGRLLDVLRQPVVRDGTWRQLECIAAWDGNWTFDCFVAFSWHAAGDQRLLVAVNYAPNQSQCNVRIAFGDLSGHRWELRDELAEFTYERDGDELQTRGLYLDVPAWQVHVFSLNRVR